MYVGPSLSHPRLLPLLLLISLLGCEKPKEPSPETVPLRESTKANGSFLLLAQVQFEMTTDETGKTRPRPGPAKLLQLHPGKNGWTATTISDPDSRVFHKATCFKQQSENQLLTIGATGAHLKTWRRRGSEWTSTSHWNPSFGGKWDRLRDYEWGDVDHDGEEELILATHDQGVVAVAEFKDGTFTPVEIFRQPNTFIHEIEVGDTNADQRLEFFATPSAPNSAEASQGGAVLQFTSDGKGGFTSKTVASFPSRHAKEILVTDLNGDGRDELYVSLEAETRRSQGKLEIIEPLQIIQFTWVKEKWRERVIATLPKGVQARVLLAGDTRGEGKPHLFVTTMRDGVWELIPAGPLEPFLSFQIDANSSGFEHAAGLADLDADGRPELYVAADDQDEIRVHRWEGDAYRSEVIFRLPRRDLTWTIEGCTP